MAISNSRHRGRVWDKKSRPRSCGVKTVRKIPLLGESPLPPIGKKLVMGVTKLCILPTIPHILCTKKYQCRMDFGTPFQTLLVYCDKIKCLFGRCIAIATESHVLIVGSPHLRKTQVFEASFIQNLFFC